MRRRRFIFTIPEHIYKQLKEISMRRNVSMSMYVLHSLIEALEHEVLE